MTITVLVAYQNDLCVGSAKMYVVLLHYRCQKRALRLVKHSLIDEK